MELNVLLLFIMIASGGCVAGNKPSDKKTDFDVIYKYIESQERISMAYFDKVMIDDPAAPPGFSFRPARLPDPVQCKIDDKVEDLSL